MKQIIRLARKSPGGVSSVEFEPPPVEIESFTAWPMITVYILGQYSLSFSYIVVAYDRNHYFGLGPIPEPKPKLADTFARY